MLRQGKTNGLHTVLETGGLVDGPIMEGVLHHVDHVIFDILHVDPERHLETAGVPNALILSNMVEALQRKSMGVRMRLIPGINDEPGNMEELASFVASLGPRVDVMQPVLCPCTMTTPSVSP